VKILRTLILSVLLLVLFSTVSCASTTKIGDILADKSKYEGNEISINGTVGETAWLAAAEKGTYQLGDGSGTIWVITTQPPPQQGQSISTKGKVQSAFTILGRSYGTVLVESKRG
jgi:hypothetical protein